MKQFVRTLWVLSVTYLSISSSPGKSKINPPNVILILTDDQGYGDITAHGNEYIRTPNMDKLHAESVRFTNFHVDPTCAPTRAALMTGKYAHRAGVWHTVKGGNHLRASEVTMADVFKESGYRTGIFGKWHLGSNYPYRPMDRGFHEWLGQGDGGTGTTDDWFDNDRVNDYYWHNGEREYREGYAPDVFYDAAINFMAQETKNQNPFFVYLPTYLPHSPHTVPDTSWTKNYKDEVKPHVSYFFAGIERVDWNIGRLLAKLEELGQSDNTILIFMSDNGGTEGVQLFNAGMRGRKAQVYEGGHRVPFFIRWPNGQLLSGKDVSSLTSHIDVLPSLIEMCGLTPKQTIDFDGRSFKSQLSNPNFSLPARVLFVENQRTIVSIPWKETAGMWNKWRLVDNQELYDLSSDPGQRVNVFDEYPEIVQQMRAEHEKYWKRVTPGDRDLPSFIVGDPKDPEVFLSTSEWYLDEELWNHAQIAKGSNLAGEWKITVSVAGNYRFEVRRWPREANAPISGVPFFSKTIDAWDKNGGVDKLIYGKEMKALPVSSVMLEVGDTKQVRKIEPEHKHVTFDFELSKGEATVKGVMLDSENKVLAGTYYVYVTKL